MSSPDQTHKTALEGKHAVPAAPIADFEVAHIPFLERPLAKLLGVKAAAPLAKMGLQTAGDLLRHFPRRYAEPGTMTDIAELVEGEHVTVMARIESASIRHMRSRAGAMLQAKVSDGVNTLSLTFFAKRSGVLRMHEDKLKPGRTGLFTGTVSSYRGERQLAHPDYLIVGVDAGDEEEALAAASRPIPMYPATAAVPTWRIERCVATVLGQMRESDVPDPLPATVRAHRKLDSLYDAFQRIHQPDNDEHWRRARRRFRYEEAFVVQAALVRRKAELRDLVAVARPKTTAADSLLAQFDQGLPFSLTEGQQQVGDEIAAALAEKYPMQRLLQGDVGSGKTIVALRAMLQVVDAGGQAALLAPTEVLASQHLRTIENLLGDLALGGMLGGADNATRVVLLTGSMGAAEKKKALLDAASGRAGIVIGTHALLSDNVQFAELGLVVVDEQHRFGVEQRDKLREKGKNSPHLLVMTATPIPRTVAMTVFGDLEVSVLQGLPAGRAPISTHIVPANNQVWMNRTWARAREEIAQGRRVYVVCSRITPSDDSAEKERTNAAAEHDYFADSDGLFVLPDHNEDSERELASVTTLYEQLTEMEIFNGVSIGMLHGQMTSADKESAMARFADGSLQLLVTTTVVEVGVDVSTASVMIIMDADRFGISQLHQLRGRIGRGTLPGICLLVAPISEGTDAFVRLQALARTTDGFELAATDLELRKEGDVLGAAQSGRGSTLRLLRVMRDSDLIAAAREDAHELIARDPSFEEHAILRAAIDQRLDQDAQKFLDRS